MRQTTRHRHGLGPIFDPFAALGRFHTDLDQLLATSPGTERAHAPPARLSETDDGYEVALLLVGADPETLDVQVEGNLLRVTGERSGIPETATRRFVLERPTGRFERSVELPAPVATDGVVARYERGVLRITLPKAAEAKPRTVSVDWA